MLTLDGARIEFDDVWTCRQIVSLASDIEVPLPSFDDLIATKRFGTRPKDLEDIRLLQVLKAERSE